MISIPLQRNRLIVLTLAALGVAAVLAQSPQMAHAESAPSNPPGQSCWHDIDSGASQCFATGTETPAQAIADDTGTAVVADPTDPAAAGARAATPSVQPRGSEATATTYLLTVLYDGTSKSGDSSSYFTMNSSICNGIVNQFPSLSTFNDRAESLQSYNGCRTTLWQNSSYGGTQYGATSSSNSFGSFNNSASSMIVTD